MDLTEEDVRIIRQIEDAIQRQGRIPAFRVRNWLSSPSLAVQTVARDLVVGKSRRIEPALSMEEVCNVMEAYYRECLIRDVKESDYVPDRSVAGHEFVAWFRSLWGNPAVSLEYLIRIKTMLRELYLEKNVPLLDTVNAILKHLFEEPAVQKFFSDWKSNTVLGEAFTLAKEWSDNHRIGPAS